VGRPFCQVHFGDCVQPPPYSRSAGAAFISLTLPAVSISAQGWPITSVSAWTLVVQPSRERPIACAERPLFAPKRGTLRLDAGAVDRGALRHRTGFLRRVEQLQPEAPMRPAVEAIVDRRRWPLLGRAVAPAAANLRTCRMPEITRRSSTRRAPGWLLGRCGPIAVHALSNNQNSAISHLPLSTPAMNQESRRASSR
jgi:hypothetical protein